MIGVDVRLYATLRKYCPGVGIGEPIPMQVAEGTTLSDVLRQLGVPSSEVKTTFVNNRHQNEDYLLNDGDRVAFFPPVAGG